MGDSEVALAAPAWVALAAPAWVAQEVSLAAVPEVRFSAEALEVHCLTALLELAHSVLEVAWVTAATGDSALVVQAAMGLVQAPLAGAVSAPG